MPSSIDNLIWILIAGAASARIAVLIAHDTILDRPRTWMFLRFPPEDNDRLGFRYQRLDRDGRNLPGGAIRNPSMIGELISCTRCLTVWTTLGFVCTRWIFGHDLTMMLATPIAAMWVAAFMARKV